MIKKKKLLIVIAIAAVLFSSCSEDNGPFERETSSVIFTVTDITPVTDPFGDIQSDGGTIEGDSVKVLFANYMKDQNWVGKKIYSDVILNSYTVSFRRTDGGYDIPKTLRRGLTLRVLADGINEIDSLEVIPATMKAEFPLNDLLYYGYERSTNYNKISMDIILEFEGHTVEGDPVSAKGYIGVIVTNWAG